MPLFNPQSAVCPYDGKQNVLCCSSCSGCGQHAHGNCGPGLRMKNAQKATCAVCNTGGVLCCSECGACGKHGHPHPA
jgi:hypothetical protein